MKRSLSVLTLLALSTSLVIVEADAIASLDERQSHERSPLAQNPETDRPEPPPVGTPDGPQRGGANRDPHCPETESSMVAFLPKKAHLHASSTQLWVYLPYAPEEIDAFRFFILDAESGEYILPPTKILLSGTPGFISIPFPPLEIGKSYTWDVSVFCEADNTKDRISALGTVQPVAFPEPSWYEEFNRLAQRRRDDPADDEILAEWTRVLESADLSELVAEPMTSCCSHDRP